MPIYTKLVEVALAVQGDRAASNDAHGGQIAGTLAFGLLLLRESALSLLESLLDSL